MGLNLRRLRSDAGLTQVSVAERASISRTHYAALELGISSNGAPANPRLATLVHLSAALGCTLDDLLFGISPDS